MRITAIEPRRHALSALFLDGEPAAQLDSETLLRSGYRVGSELSGAELSALKEASERRRAEEKALYLLEHRNHFKRELEEKLRRAVSAEAAQAAAGRMEQLGLIDDARYARDYAARLLEQKGFSARRAQYELCRKGVDRGLAERVVSELAPDPVEKIREILERKYPGARQDEKIRRRAAGAMQRLGYGFEDIRSAMREWDETTELDEDE